MGGPEKLCVECIVRMRWLVLILGFLLIHVADIVLPSLVQSLNSVAVADDLYGESSR